MSKLWPTATHIAERLELSLDNPAHAYLFCGQPGYGTELTAQMFAARLLGIHDKLTINTLAHQNITYIQPIDGKKKISIAQIHELIHHSVQTKFRSGLPKIYIIDRADQLSREAATALLKTLEEPNADAIFILITHSLHAVLPTIRSRVVTLTLPALSNKAIQQYLEANTTISSERATEITNLVSGKIGLAVELTDEEIFAKFAEEYSQARKFATGTVSEKFAIAKQVVDKQQTATFLDRLSYTIPSESSILVTAFNQERIVLSEKQIGSNVNPRFVLENLALQWKN